MKKLALRAGLNCGECRNKQELQCDEHPVCKKWELHRFRKTFATMHHEGGLVSVRKIQKWLRHSSLETTLRYLACSEDITPQIRDIVNTTFADLQGPTLVDGAVA
ncbi:MAG TPA: hypothetical protein VGL97_07850 [Bryobacteraceae bacterium]